MKLLLVAALAATSITVKASDYENEGVQEGQNIRTYNHSTGRSRDITVDRISEYGGTTTIETYDHDTNTYESIEIESPRKANKIGLDATEWY